MPTFPRQCWTCLKLLKLRKRISLIARHPELRNSDCMTDGSFLFDVRWRCLNSQFQDWLKIRSYHPVCQISTFSYYSPLNFFFKLSPTTKGEIYSLILQFPTALFWDHKQLTKETDIFFITCFPPKICALLSSLGQIIILSFFKYLTKASKELFSMLFWPEMFGQIILFQFIKTMTRQ